MSECFFNTQRDASENLDKDVRVIFWVSNFAICIFWVARNWSLFFFALVKINVSFWGH